MPKMNVLSPNAYDDVSQRFYGPGQTVEVTQEVAEAWVKASLAEIIKEEAAIPASTIQVKVDSKPGLNWADTGLDKSNVDWVKTGLDKSNV